MRILLYLLIWIFCITPQLTHAVEVAIISSEKGIVYAEESLATPVGYLRRGKKVYVGSTPLKKGLVYSIVLTGKIAFIQSKDIYLLKEGEENKKITEHDVTVIEGKEEELFSINNHVTPMIGFMDMGQQWADLRQALGTESQGNNFFSYWRLLFEHRDPRFKLNWGLGMDFMGKNEGPIKMSTWGIEGNVNFAPIRTRLFALDATWGVLGFPVVKMTNSLAFTPESSGKMWGYQYGVQTRLFPYSQWGFIAGLTYTNLALNIAPIVTEKESSDPAIPVVSQRVDKISGFNLFLGFSYKL